MIELLVVIVVMGILAAISYPMFLGFLRKAHYAEAKHQMGVVARELRTLHLERQNYPLEVNPNSIPAGVVNWPQKIPYDSTLDYDHWASSDGKCYVQLAFWGDNNQQEYTSYQETTPPGSFQAAGSNLILTVAVYECTQASAGPIN